MYEVSEVQKLIPQLEETIEKKERLLRQQQTTVETHLKRIAELETEVKTLQVFGVGIDDEDYGI